MAATDELILCDTNVLIEFYKNNPTVLKAMKDIGRPNLAISVITQAELYFGALNKVELQQIRRHLSLLRSLSITHPISEIFLELMISFSLSHSLAIPDALIAATALHHNVALYTYNIKDFRFIPGLKLHNKP